ncbi:phage tail sheath family protein [Bacilliculturomica massiliensis]|uniref:phage tail sheath family protein n=1 Tax=Bacilliculturomica massiliensis TaxID=1917867 RepID=UPI00103046F7|nr:phage tail sheath family protein [Bacilliculturomica massiliensis]
MLGGGTFITQNKTLPGAYINFVSAARATAALSDRGYAAMALELDWGADGQVFAVTASDLEKDSQKLLGYAYTDEKLKGLRDLFRSGLRKAYLYRLNSGAKAANDFAEARYSGLRGNDVRIVITAVEGEEPEGASYSVKTYLDTKEVDAQTVRTAADLADNDFVVWKKGAALAATAGTALTGGSNKPAVTGDDYQLFLDKIESYSFNTLGCLSEDKAVCALFQQFTKRMRNEAGVKFQTVLYRSAADFEGVISVENSASDAGWPASSAVYWVTGAEAGCAVNKSLTNAKYDGEFAIETGYRQSELEAGLKGGKLMFHRVGDDVRVLEDINTFVSFTDEMGADFADNQTMRVLDQIGNDDALLFNTRYLGVVPNDDGGRISFWNDIVKLRQEMLNIRAIENFKAEDVTVRAGATKKSVVVENTVRPVNAMTQLYMTTVVA